MVRDICKDENFLAKKSEAATIGGLGTARRLERYGITTMRSLAESFTGEHGFEVVTKQQKAPSWGAFAISMPFLSFSRI
ncbi:MAG: hypothetical protein PUC58_02660 [Oscillospiraceae bacterium]|nr:hypothetical protein [Oscillospiraceae bacterium]